MSTTRVKGATSAAAITKLSVTDLLTLSNELCIEAAKAKETTDLAAALVAFGDAARSSLREAFGVEIPT